MSTFLSYRATRRLPLLFASGLAGLFAAAGLIAVARPTQATGAADITIVVSQPTLIANNVSTALIMVTVSDTNQTLPGDLITFSLSSSTLGTIMPVTTTTDLSGTALITWTAGTVAGSGQLIVTDGDFTQTANITLTAGPLVTITVSPDPVTVTAGMTRSFTATGQDLYHNPVMISPTWSSNVGSAAVVTYGLIATATFTAQSILPSSPISLTGFITATDSVSGMASVNIVPGAPYTITSLWADSAVVDAGGSTFVNAIAKDKYGNLVADRTPVTFTTDLGTITPPPRLTTNGFAFAQQSSERAGMAHITASSGVAQRSTAVYFVPGEPVSITLQANPMAHRGRTASCPTAPAQNPACGFLAPGSSRRLASAIRLTLPMLSF